MNKLAYVMMGFQVGAICAVVNVVHHSGTCGCKSIPDEMPELASDLTGRRDHGISFASIPGFQRFQKPFAKSPILVFSFSNILDFI